MATIKTATMTIWHKAGIVTLAKDIKTGRFVKKERAQNALDRAMESRKDDQVMLGAFAGVICFFVALACAVNVSPAEYTLDTIYNNGAGHTAIYLKECLSHMWATIMSSLGGLLLAGAAVRQCFK
jgi:hypothetical protein